MMPPLVITLVLALTGGAYLRGWRRLHSTSFRGIPAWRAASFFPGLLCVWVAAASPVASLDGNMLTAHMAQHLLLMTFAPPLIWLGSPVPPLLYSLPPGILRRMRPRTRSLGRALGNPAFCWFSAAAVLVAWHVPALFRLGMESATWHAVEHASFLAAGLLFWWPVIQPWPSVPRWSRWSMLLYLFLATLPCDVLAGLLVFSDRVAYPVYLCMPRQSGLSALEDQQCAGALMWTCVTVVFLVAGTILSTQLLSPQASREEAA
jgi:cytochrome c oxidase assembly factor CtaG